MIAEVIINSNVKNLNKTFDYNIPKEMEDKVTIGSRVLVQFGRIKMYEEGFVVNIKDRSEYEVKDLAIVQERDFIDEPKVEMAKWMARRYFCNVSECIKLMLPPGTGSKDVSKRVKEKVLNYVRLAKSEDEINFLIESKKLKSDKQIKLLKFLIENTFNNCDNNKINNADNNNCTDVTNEGFFISDLEALTDVSKSIMKTLEKNGYIEIYEKQVDRNPFIHKVINKNTKLSLTKEQQHAYEMVETAIDDYMNSEFLLFGVTGSR